MSINDINSLSHTKWNCKYHIVFAPKYRRKVFYREKRVEIGKILRQLCEWRGVKIIGLMSIKWTSKSENCLQLSLVRGKPMIMRMGTYEIVKACNVRKQALL